MVKPGRALADSEWTTLQRAAEVLIQGAAVQPVPERVADNVETFLVSGRSRRAWRVRVLLTLIELLPIPMYGLRFSNMTIEDRRRLMEDRMIGGRHVWAVCAKIRVLVFMGLYGDEAMQPTIGFVPVPLRKRYTTKHPSINAIGLTQ